MSCADASSLLLACRISRGFSGTFWPHSHPIHLGGVVTEQELRDWKRKRDDDYPSDDGTWFANHPPCNRRKQTSLSCFRLVALLCPLHHLSPHLPDPSLNPTSYTLIVPVPGFAVDISPQLQVVNGMAGVIQAGDLVKLAELAWRVYDYGWNPELNASTSPQCPNPSSNEPGPLES